VPHSAGLSLLIVRVRSTLCRSSWSLHRERRRIRLLFSGGLGLLTAAALRTTAERPSAGDLNAYLRTGRPPPSDWAHRDPFRSADRTRIGAPANCRTRVAALARRAGSSASARGNHPSPGRPGPRRSPLRKGPHDHSHNLVVFVTGANGGLGREFVRPGARPRRDALCTRGPHPSRMGRPTRRRARDSRRDQQDSIADAVAAAATRTVVVNNAGVGGSGRGCPPHPWRGARRLRDQRFGALRGSPRHSPRCWARNGGGALVDTTRPELATPAANAYSASRRPSGPINQLLPPRACAVGTSSARRTPRLTDTPRP